MPASNSKPVPMVVIHRCEGTKPFKMAPKS